MRKWIGIGLGTLLACGIASPACLAQATSQQPSVQQVRELMQVVGMGRMLGQMNTRMAAVMQKALPCVPASYWQGFADANATNALIGRMVPVYQRHFTAQDIQGLLQFYRSPLGQKVIREMPKTMAEGMQIGRQWGQQRGQTMIADLKQKGTLNTQGQCPAAPAAGN